MQLKILALHMQIFTNFDIQPEQCTAIPLQFPRN
jgi:hypothetical protein